MSKRTTIFLLLFIALLCIGYAVYRSTGETITIVEAGRQTVYGDPQHGLILGLCVIAGLCILSAVPLITSRDTWKSDDTHNLTRRNP